MDYIIHLAILLSIYSILALSLNLIVGYSGLFSITHVAFYGIGAYATAILSAHHGMNFFLTVIIGVAVTFIVSLLLGIVLSRFSDDYFAIVSIGFAVISYAFYLNFPGLTEGAMGIPGVAKPSFFGFVFSSNIRMLMLIMCVLVCVYFLCRFVVRSSFGRALKAVRENEKTLQVYGYNTTLYKLAVFSIGAMMTSVAGSMFGTYMTFVGPSMFMLRESIFVLVIIIMGGLGTLSGSILGTLFLILLPEALRFLGLPDTVAAQVQQIIYGTILILLMIYRPQGFVGAYRM
ncbi:MAG: branched-chain amino acid ABC transporter permease [Nitrospirota bacterium]